jgi:hypothetical protein
MIDVDPEAAGLEDVEDAGAADPEAELAALSAALDALTEHQKQIDAALQASRSIAQQNRVRVPEVGYQGGWGVRALGTFGLSEQGLLCV